MHVLFPRMYRRCVPLVGMVGGWWTSSSIIVLPPVPSCFLAWIRIITEVTETGRKARKCGRGRGPHFTLEEFLCWTHWLMPAETRRRLSLIQMLRDMCPDYYTFSLPPWISFSFLCYKFLSFYLSYFFCLKSSPSSWTFFSLDEFSFSPLSLYSKLQLADSKLSPPFTFSTSFVLLSPFHILI